MAVSWISVAAAAHLVAVLVQHQVADDQQRLAPHGGGAGPAQQPAQPGDDLLQAERLGHVVVAARRQPGDAVLDRVLGGQEQHRHLREFAPQPAEHRQPVHVGQHHVEHHRVRPELARGPQRARAVALALRISQPS